MGGSGAWLLLLQLALLSALVSASPPYVRRNQASLSDEEVTRYVNAILEMKRRGIYDQFVRVHELSWVSTRGGPAMMEQCIARGDQTSEQCFDWGHGGPHFLPWHRKYLLEFEKQLRNIDPNVTLIYWDWTVDNSTDPAKNRLFSPLFMGGNGDKSNHSFVSDGPFAFWPLKYTEGSPYLQRIFGGDPELFLGPITLPKIENLNQLYRFPLFDKEPYLTLGNFSRESTFRKALEGFPGLPGFEFSWGGYLHARVHTFMSGSMLPGSSPNDPIFFLHHTFLDRIWSQWAKLNKDHPKYLPMSGGPRGTNPSDQLHPWDGYHNTDEYSWYFQYPVFKEGELTYIEDMLVEDYELGYTYEGLEYE